MEWAHMRERKCTEQTDRLGSVKTRLFIVSVFVKISLEMALLRDGIA
jgi:hypothetical protein